MHMLSVVWGWQAGVGFVKWNGKAGLCKWESRTVCKSKSRSVCKRKSRSLQTGKVFANGKAGLCANGKANLCANRQAGLCKRESRFVCKQKSRSAQTGEEDTFLKTNTARAFLSSTTPSKYLCMYTLGQLLNAFPIFASRCLRSV